MLFTHQIFGQAPVLVSAQRLGGSDWDGSSAITVDHSGNIYTTDYFYQTADFDPSASVYNLTSNGFSDIFISKLDSSGNFKWAKSLGSLDFDHGYSIETDQLENVYITGQFSGTVDFDPGPGVFNLTSSMYQDAYILKLDSSGIFIWARNIYSAVGSSITTDILGNVYASGYFGGATDLDPTTGTDSAFSAGAADGFIVKLNSSGNFLWAKQIGGADDDEILKLQRDHFGNIYMCGGFYGTSNFDPGASNFHLTSAGDQDIFISKLDSFGNFKWALQIGDTSWDQARSMTVDSNGNFYIAGNFEVPVDFDPGPGIFILSPVGSTDNFIGRYDSFGNLVWAKSFGSIYPDFINSIAIDNKGNVYSTGDYSGTVDFDPSSGVYNLAGYHNIFILKLNSSGNFSWARSMGSSGDDGGYSIYADDDERVYVTGRFEDTVDFDPGNGIFNMVSAGSTDIFILKLKPCTSSSSTINITSCRYTSPSGNYTWTISGTYMDTIRNAEGCDSVITFNITIDHSFNSTLGVITPTVCNSYTSPSGNYTWINSGTYKDTIPNFEGCDSVITIILTIPTVITAVTINGATLTANAIFAGYQWIDCNTMLPISGETNKDFTATSNGSYAVIVFQNNCTDTSTCFTINNVGIEENSLISGLTISDNPTNGKFTLWYTGHDKAGLLKIYDVNGNLVFQEEIAQWSQYKNIDIRNQQSGIYFCKLIWNNSSFANMKVIKQ